MTSDQTDQPRSTASDGQRSNPGNDDTPELTRLHQTFDGHERNRDRMALLAFDLLAARQ